MYGQFADLVHWYVYVALYVVSVAYRPAPPLHAGKLLQLGSKPYFELNIIFPRTVDFLLTPKLSRLDI